MKICPRLTEFSIILQSYWYINSKTVTISSKLNRFFTNEAPFSLLWEDPSPAFTQEKEKSIFKKIGKKVASVGHLLPGAYISVWCSYQVMLWKSLITFQMSSMLVRMS